MLKIVVIIFTVILIGLGATFLYFNRAQSIDFSGYMPSKFELCSEIISEQDDNYLGLKKWFKANINGWQNSFVSYVPGYVFSSNKMIINVMPSTVVVNYQSSDGWSQVIKNVDTMGLISSCK